MKKIISVVGARPNFMKVAPIHKAFRNYEDKITHLICHTGQHYDEKMSKVFFEDLELPQPDFYLGVGSGSHAEQTANVMIEFEKILINEKPDLVLVVGDVNSTIACSLTAKKLHIKVVHVEAGLRSFDMEMPEEINRILTDRISDFLFVTEKSGLENLKNEGVDDSKVFFVGNVMIDSLVHYQPKIDKSNILEHFKLASVISKENSHVSRLTSRGYVLVTLHRPSNVDTKESLEKLVKFLNIIAKERMVVFPIHPRTKSNLEKYALIQTLSDTIILSEPIGYIDFQALIKNAELIVTDSGGIQEETTYLGVQCITLRTSTERPSTVDIGTNQLIGVDLEKAEVACLNVLAGNKKAGTIPELWDGKAAERIAEILCKEEV
ncbi:MAG: UDP-N-acetylglucosamine 2-epimerase (non-hydrolyzing) [Bacteroidetes bacterium]|nr:UDP-N-acetylglucosamine 2-epimerase (non-hydrolyzing) [Bacteroidota bacterium]MBU1115698.1 UDP-N-acetylglucosamine 2-epimerase (non-hydrolyzing) [Bacteroidota bacterium]MBU1799945.1 UDP-N-acetylglucosamine 2-epimerase (non-hydrolyzing) [Bacteroidota bacterium]